MPTANAEGQIESEGSVRKVSVRRIFRSRLDRHGLGVRRRRAPRCSQKTPRRGLGNGACLGVHRMSDVCTRMPGTSRRNSLGARRRVRSDTRHAFCSCRHHRWDHGPQARGLQARGPQATGLKATGWRPAGYRPEARGLQRPEARRPQARGQRPAGNRPAGHRPQATGPHATG